MSIDQALFRRVLGHWASGVTVVTTAVDGQRHGLTASSFSSLSLDPPLVLVCLDRRITGYRLVEQAGHFAINILDEDGEYLSRQFASKNDDKFAGVAFTEGVLGAPLLDASLAQIECRLHAVYDGGDHGIFVGAVERMQVREDKPLLYFRGGYAALA